jgi:ribonuclease HI
MNHQNQTQTDGILGHVHYTSYEFSIPVEKTSMNNQAKYHAALKWVKLPREVNAEVVEIFGDS